jgi:hypothetical protein
MDYFTSSKEKNILIFKGVIIKVWGLSEVV